MFLELAYMFDATRRLWAGVWGTMVTFLELAYMFDATQDYGSGRGE